MSRLIRYDDAIERLGAHLMADAQIDWGGTASTDIEEWKELADMILNGVPTVDAVSEWIPCSERLPIEFSDDERVLATTDVDGLGVILTPAYDVKSWYLKGYISAWMPLPKPWKGADDE